MHESAADAEAVLKRADQLYTEEAVESALDRMAREITERVSGSCPVVLCVMNGGIVPTGKLVTRLGFPLQLDYVHATRYRGDTRGGELDWLVRPHLDLRGRVVLAVDDILDEGITLQEILSECERLGAQKVLTAVLVDKRVERRNGLRRADFVGLECEDRYVFGYGMDYKGFLRNAPGIYALPRE